jgi:hypothetical protein
VLYADTFPDAKAGWIEPVDADSRRHPAPGPERPRASAVREP